MESPSLWLNSTGIITLFLQAHLTSNNTPVNWDRLCLCSAFRMKLDNLKEEEYSRAVIYGGLKVPDSGCPGLLIAGRAGGPAQPSSAVRFGSRMKSP